MNLNDIFNSRQFKDPSPEELEKQRKAFALKSPEDIAFEKERPLLQKLACIDGLFRDEIRDLTFSKFKRRRELLMPQKIAESWNPDFPQGLFFFGPVGTGKSHLLTALCIRWASRDRGACFKRLSGLLASFKANFDGMEDLKLKFQTSRLLFVDDIGTEQGSPFAEDQIFQILDYRIRYGGHTFGSSNLSPDEIAVKYHPRIIDRLSHLCTFVEVKGKSYRQLIGEERSSKLYAQILKR